MEQNLNSIKKTNFSYCLSSCIVNHLERSNIKIHEYDLYCTENMLYMELNQYGSLESPIENEIRVCCSSLGIEFKKISDNDIAALDNFLSKFGNIIINIDIKHLKYSDFYKNGVGHLARHYINILSGERGIYEISDTYIPTIPISSFEGICMFDNHIIKDSNIFSIQVNEVSLIDENVRKSNILKSINSFFSMIDNQNPYELFTKSIQTHCDNREKLYEIVASLAVGGVLASRELFHKNVLQIINNKNLELRFQEIQDNYFKLRLLIIKLSFSKAKRDLDCIFEKIKEIKKIEISTYLSIKHLIKGAAQ